MLPFLFHYCSQFTEPKYMLVYAEDYKKAYTQLDAWLNTSGYYGGSGYTITLATIGPIIDEPGK